NCTLNISWLKSRALRNARQHFRADLIAVVECKDKIRPRRALQSSMGTRLSLDAPADPQQGRQHPLCLCRWPLAHGTTEKTLPMSGTFSPCSNLSARTRNDKACALSMASCRLCP